jgi:hypothetical protein
MKLDVTDLRYVTPEEFRVLTAVRILSVFIWRIPQSRSHINLG